MTKTENKVSYYWLCSYPLENGSIILPGNWGRMISLYRSDDGLLLYLREKILEEIRIREFPNLPSRMTSAFLCLTIEDAIKFRDSNNRSFDILYKVEVIDDKPVFKTDWTFLNWPMTPFLLKDLENMAYKYWQATDIQNPEILTESRIKIIQRCD